MTSTHRYSTVFAVLVCVLQCSGCDWFVNAEQRIARAESDIRSGDHRAAFIELQNAVRNEPGNVRARLMLAELSLQTGDSRSAEKELSEAIKHGAAIEQSAPLRAEIRLAQGEAAKLLAEIDAGQSGLREPARSTYRGMALLSAGKREEAAHSFKAALAFEPRSSRARTGLAEALVASRQWDAALEELEVALKYDDADAAALSARGTLLLRQGEFPRAADALSRARTSDDARRQLTVAQRAGLLAALADAQLGMDEADEAQQTHAELAKLAPNSPGTRLLAARLAITREDYATAVAEARQALSSAPNYAPARMALSVALLAQGSINQAEAQLSELVQLAPENMQARKLLAKVNLQLQRPDAAARALLPMQSAEDPETEALLGLVDLQRGESAAGIARLERSLASRPGNAELKTDLAGAYLANQQREKAIELLRAVPAGGAARDSLLIAALAAEEGADSAREEIGRIVAANLNDLEVLNRSALLYAQLGEFERARQVLSAAAKHKRGDVATLVARARVEGAAGRMSEADAAARQALAVDPANESALLVLAQIASRSGDVRTAIAKLEQIRAKNPEAIEARVALARAYARAHNAREVDAVIREMASAAKNAPALANRLGEIYMDMGRFEPALRWFRSAEGVDRTAASALNVARTQLAQGDTDAARQTLQKILQQHPDSIPAASQWVMLDLRDGQRENALARLAALKSAHPKQAAVAVLEGDVLMILQQYEKAAAAFEAAARSAPSASLAIRWHRARRLGRLADPAAPLNEWLERRPNDVSVRLALAEHYALTEQTARAIEQYELASQGSQANPMALNNLAWLYHQRGDSRAEAMAKRAYEAAPSVAAIADTYGWILVARGRVKEALPILERAAAAGANMPEVRYHYAAALARAGEREAARRELTQLINTQAEYSSAVEARKLLVELNAASLAAGQHSTE